MVAVCKIVLAHIRVDDWVFGVSSVSKDGFESPVASAVPGGAFKPYVAPAKRTVILNSFQGSISLKVAVRS